jgi:hypothetical protein
MYMKKIWKKIVMLMTNYISFWKRNYFKNFGHLVFSRLVLHYIRSTIFFYNNKMYVCMYKCIKSGSCIYFCGPFFFTTTCFCQSYISF